MRERASGQGSHGAAMEAARRAVALDARAVQAVAEQIDDSFLRAALLVRGCKGKVLVAGMGTSGATARRLAHLLSCAGTPSLFIHAADALHGTLGAVASTDIVIVISKGGESDELNEFVRRARVCGAKTVALTSAAKSSLARQSDLKIVTVFPEDADPGGVMAMGSSLGFSAVGDALVVSLMTLRGYGRSLRRLLFLHPGGAVGKRAASTRQGGSV